VILDSIKIFGFKSLRTNYYLVYVMIVSSEGFAACHIIEGGCRSYRDNYL